MSEDLAADGVARATRTTFRLECGVAVWVDAPPERIWDLLTDAARFTEWNTTVSRMEGRIEEGGRLTIETPSAPGRVFRPKVSRVEPGRAMVWSDGMAPMFRGVRTFTLAPRDGGTELRMVEVLSGLMLPLIAGSLPDFVPIFATYAADLKRAAERAG
ncbi:MAG: SRPBCC domain-containing protein [Sandaracinaceae bacterium]|nr:SRPBCC domain-containing protein [Sandaracinaceae bacterium]